MRTLLVCLCSAVLAGSVWGLALQAAPEKAGAPAERIPLADSTGQKRTLAEFRNKKALVVVFLGTECPMSNSYAEPLSRLSERYAARGVQFVGVNSLPEEDAAEVAKHAAEYRIAFPVLKDGKQALADALGARVTPAAFVLDGERTVRYRGRIDDQYVTRLKKKNQVTSRDLEEAIEAVLAGKPVAKAETQALGCAIPRPQKSAAAAAPVTFHRDVLPILQERCQGCHRPGQVAPFSLLTYAEAKNWAQEIKEFTGNRQMPPWKAEPGHGEFEGVRRLTDAQVKLIAGWVDAGAPEGSAKDAPPAKEWSVEWSLGKPDVVLTVPEEYTVPASGDDEFRVFVLPTELTEAKSLVAIEVRAGNPRVVHHVVAFADATGKARELDAKDPAPGYESGPGGVEVPGAEIVGVWAPGNFPRRFPAGIGRPLKKGTDIAIQVHYHKTGKPEKDRTSIALYFADAPIEKTVRTGIFGPFNIDIPPDAKRHPTEFKRKLATAATIYNVMPHMHLLGKEIQAWAILPDGTRKELVWVKDWDYRWQDTYWFKEPVHLPAGSEIHVQGYYDNTSENPLNPNNPPKRVTFGEQTTDEMCFAIVEFTMAP